MAALPLETIRASLAAVNEDGMRREVFFNAGPALRMIVIAGMRDHFQRSEGPSGVPWLPVRRVRGGDKPLLDTGALRNSVNARMTPSELIMFASHPGANVHNYGATITPKSARALAIPLSREAARVGSPRQNRFPRPLFVLVSKSGNAFLAESVEGTPTMHYLLRRSVTIPAREFVGISARTWDKLHELFANRQADYLARLVTPTGVTKTRR